MLEIPTAGQLAEQAKQDVEAEINGSLGSRLRLALANALAGFGYLIMKMLQYVSRQLFVDLADEPYALLWADIHDVTPTEATAAGGPVVVDGTAGSVLAGTEILQRADGVQYELDAGAVVGLSGQVTVTVTCLTAGTTGNADAGTELTFVSPPAGIEAAAVVDADGITDGFEAETTASVQARTLEKIRAERRGGSESDYEVWAKEVAGIGSAYAVGSYAGAGTVLLVVAQTWDPTDPLQTPVPSSSLISSVETYIESRKPAGLHLVAVQGPTLQQLDPYIVLNPDTTAIRDAVTKSLALALANVEPNSYAYYDDLVAAIDRAAGEEHHRLFVDDGSGNYGPYDTLAGYTSLLVPGTITWTEPP